MEVVALGNNILLVLKIFVGLRLANWNDVVGAISMSKRYGKGGEKKFSNEFGFVFLIYDSC